MVESLEDEVGDLLDDAGVGGAEELADLLELVDGGNFVVVGCDAVDHPRAPVGLHRPPALIHGCPRPNRLGTAVDGSEDGIWEGVAVDRVRASTGRREARRHVPPEGSGRKEAWRICGSF